MDLFMEFKKEVPIISLEVTMIILLSYFGLYFGGSLLALIQIFYNMIKKVPFCCCCAAKVKEINLSKLDKCLRLFSSTNHNTWYNVSIKEQYSSFILVHVDLIYHNT